MSTRMKLPGPHEPKKQPLPNGVVGFRKALKKASDAAELAGIYHDDGALLSAARMWRIAATEVERAHNLREQSLGT